MYAAKGDKEVRGHMESKGYLAPEYGSHKGKEGWDPLFIRSDGHKNPCKYVDIYGRTKEEQTEHQRVLERFESIAAGNGAEEEKIRQSFSKHMTAMNTHMENRLSAQVNQTKSMIESTCLTYHKNSLETKMASNAVQDAGSVEDILSGFLLKHTNGDIDIGIKLLSQVSAAANVRKKKVEIATADEQAEECSVSAESFDTLAEKEKKKITAVMDTMKKRLSQQKSGTVEQNKLAVWNSDDEAEEPAAKKPRTTQLKRTDTLSNDNKMILLKKAQECIMDRLKAKHKD
eukprot:SAG11_NODE_2697_length_3079_cov_231.148322_3_plen_286_part_01